MSTTHCDKIVTVLVPNCIDAIDKVKCGTMSRAGHVGMCLPCQRLARAALDGAMMARRQARA